MAVDKETFRNCMARFAAGVTVVTTIDAEGRPCGLTATAFSSVSAEPPLALVCVDKRSETHASFAHARAFGVNFLADAQIDVSGHFAKSGVDKFADTAWHKGELGMPLLEGTIGFVECRLVYAYEGGDHTIFVGEIERGEAREGKPLVYFHHAYREIG